MANIYAVVARRFPVVDEEAGTVLGLGVFLRKPGVAMRRNQFSEWFVIDQGELRANPTRSSANPPARLLACTCRIWDFNVTLLQTADAALPRMPGPAERP